MSILTDARAFQAQALAGADGPLRELAAQMDLLLRRLLADAALLQARADAARAAGTPDAEWRATAASRAHVIAQSFATELTRLTSALSGPIEAAQQQAVLQGIQAAQSLIAPVLAQAASIGQSWQTPNVAAVHAAIGLTAHPSPVAQLLSQLGPDAARTVRQALVSGVASGRNPRVVAQEIARAGALPMVRAEVIARTEMLRAFRTASQHSYEANRHIVPKYKRIASKSLRTCPSCLALDQKVYDSAELMPLHPQDRCAMVPLPVSFADLGLDVPEIPEPQWESGADWFARQPAALQEQVLGPGGRTLYQAGAPLTSFSRVVESPEYGPTLQRRTNAQVAASLGRRQAVSEAAGG